MGAPGEYYKNSLALSRQDNDPVATAKNLADFANTYRAQGNFLEAIPLYREALRLNERNHVLYDSGAILSDLSDSYLKTGDSRRVDELHAAGPGFLSKRKGRPRDTRARIRKRDPPACSKTTSPGRCSISGWRWKCTKNIPKRDGSPRSCAISGRSIPASSSKPRRGSISRRAQALRQQLDDQIEILGTVLARAKTLQEQNQLPEAEALLRFCENQAKQKHLQGKLCETYLQLSSLYSLRRDPVNALYYQTLGRKTQDGLPSTAIQAGMQQIIAKNESDKEIAEIKRQKRRQTVIGVLVGGLLLVLTGILAWKRKSVKKWAPRAPDQQGTAAAEKKGAAAGHAAETRATPGKAGPRPRGGIRPRATPRAGNACGW